jgi:hypothetical protein
VPAALSRSWRRPAALGSDDRGQRLDRFELAVLVAFGAFSLWMIGVDVFSAAAHGRVWTGTDGIYLPDQLQYLAWIRDASKHVLISDMFVLNGTPHDYLQPAIAISGGLTALGVPPWLSLLLWKPVAVIAVFFAVRAFCRRAVGGIWPQRAVGGVWAQRAALLLALFYGSVGTYPAIDESLPFLSWGYPFTLLATAALVWALLDYERARAQRRLTWVAPALGLVAAWLHPWQGEVLILVIVGAEAIAWREDGGLRDRLALPALTIGATLVPLAYYAALDHFDPVWRLGSVATLADHWSLGRALPPLVPLIAVAVWAYRERPRSFMSAAVRVWPVAAVVVFVLSKWVFAATPLHALTGITVPLAVLAVQVARAPRMRRLPGARPLAWLLVAAATLPAAVYMVNLVRQKQAPASNGMNFISHDEQRALSYLASDPQPGGVYTDFILGALVPSETGRRTYVGNCDWSVPHCSWRFNNTWSLLLWHGEWGSQARWFVRRSGARFVLASCHTRNRHLQKELAPLLVAVHRFGCASVYEVRPGPRHLI